MFDPAVFAEPFLLNLAAVDCAFDDSFDSAFDVCGTPTADDGGRGGRVAVMPRRYLRRPTEDPDELLALI
jgi:hypothetical protein